MRCLVTGVAGFIGSHLADRLLAEGHEVCGIDSFVDFYPRKLKERNLEQARSWKHFTLVEKDLLDLFLEPLLEGVDWVFHLAAQAGVRASWGTDFSRYVQTNVLATQYLLEALIKLKTVRRFIYASSSSIYGETHCLPLTEETLPQPLSPYGVSKLAGEQLCMLYQRNAGIPVVALRYFTVYGPRQRPDMALQRFCQALLEQKPISIYGNGCQTRDFTYVDDIVEANLRAAASEAASGEIFNIAGGTQITLLNALTLLQEISGRAPTLSFTREQCGDVYDTIADISHARHLLNYTPRVSLREGLTRQFDALADQHLSVPELLLT